MRRELKMAFLCDMCKKEIPKGKVITERKTVTYATNIGEPKSRSWKDMPDQNELQFVVKFFPGDRLIKHVCLACFIEFLGKINKGIDEEADELSDVHKEEG
jgi:hypothetical protein